MGIFYSTSRGELQKLRRATNVIAYCLAVAQEQMRRIITPLCTVLVCHSISRHTLNVSTQMSLVNVFVILFFSKTPIVKIWVNMASKLAYMR